MRFDEFLYREMLNVKKLSHCNRLLKAGCNNVVRAIVFLVVTKSSEQY